MSALTRRACAAAVLFSLAVPVGLVAQVTTAAPASASNCKAEGPGYGDMPGSVPATQCEPEPTPPPTPEPIVVPETPEVVPTPAPVPAPTPNPAPRPASTPVIPAAPAPAPVIEEPAPVAEPVVETATEPAVPAVQTATDNACPSPTVSNGVNWWLLALAALAIAALAAAGAIRLWLFSGHRWPAGLRRIVAGPDHGQHHRLTDADGDAEDLENDLEDETVEDNDEDEPPPVTDEAADDEEYLSAIRDETGTTKV